MKACCPFHNEKTPSFFIDDSAGRYRCFGAGCGKSGDVIQFIEDWRGMGFRDAVSVARDLAGLSTLSVQTGGRSIPQWSDRSVWQAAVPAKPIPRESAVPEPLNPIPADIALPSVGRTLSVFDRQNNRDLRIKPSHIHVYRQPNGTPLCLVLRSPTERGGKFFLQVKWRNDGLCGWELLRFTGRSPRPIYGLEDMPDWSKSPSRQLLIVEGETTCDAAKTLLLDKPVSWLCLTAMGGAQSVGLADWKSLFEELGRYAKCADSTFKIVIWPDADPDITDRSGVSIDRRLQFAERVKNAMTLAAGSRFLTGGNLRFYRILPPSDVKPGWDIADAATEAWTAERLQKHIRDNSITMHENNATQIEPPENSPQSGIPMLNG